MLQLLNINFTLVILWLMYFDNEALITELNVGIQHLNHSVNLTQG